MCKRSYLLAYFPFVLQGLLDCPGLELAEEGSSAADSDDLVDGKQCDQMWE